MNRLAFIKGAGFIIILTSLCGCATVLPNQTATNVIYYNDVIPLIHSLGMGAFNEVILQDEYEIPSTSWITDVVYPEFFQRQKVNHLWEYAAQSNDCDSFSGRFRLLAQELNNLTNNSNKRGVAVGEFYYNDTPKSRHAINFFIVKNRQAYEIVYFEPQNGKILYLTDEQKRMGYAWII